MDQQGDPVSEKKRASSGDGGQPGIHGEESFFNVSGATVPPEALHTVFEVGRCVPHLLFLFRELNFSPNLYKYRRVREPCSSPLSRHRFYRG